MDLSWMAWTWQTATFFGCILLALAGMTVGLARRWPAPRCARA
jgi:predicted small integral membrane protein